MVVESRLSVRSLSVRFGTHLALDSLDLDVPDGKIVALLGDGIWQVHDRQGSDGDYPLVREGA